MGESASETVKEIEDIRGRIDDEFAELERRMPAIAKVGKKAAGVALGGGLGGTILLKVLRGKRKKRLAAENVLVVEQPNSKLPYVAMAMAAAAAFAVWRAQRAQ